MDAAASALLLGPDGNLHNNGTNKRTLKAFLGVLVYCRTGFRKDVLVRHSQMKGREGVAAAAAAPLGPMRRLGWRNVSVTNGKRCPFTLLSSVCLHSPDAST